MKKIGLILSAAAVVLFAGDGSAMYDTKKVSNAGSKSRPKLVQVSKEERHRLAQMHHKTPGATVQIRKDENRTLEKERAKKLESELAAHKQEINTLKHENEALKHENAAIEAQIAEIIEPQQTSTSN